MISIDAILQKAKPAISFNYELTFGPITLPLTLENRAQKEWIDYHFAQFKNIPELDDLQLPHQWSFSVLQSDVLFQGVHKLTDPQHNSNTEVLNFDESRLYYCDFPNEISVSMQPGPGACWIIDRANHHVAMIYSLRYRKTNIMIARTVKELIYRQLMNKGWRSYHAGSIAFGEDIYLVLGDANAGKTTLLLALANMGGRYISNERTHLKETDAGDILQVGHPQPINFRLSTANAFPQMKELALASDYLLHRQVLLNRSKVIAQKDTVDWSTLKGKLLSFPHELLNIFKAPPPRWGGKVKGIIVPDGQMEECAPQALKVDESFKREIIYRNRIKSFFHTGARQDWLRLCQNKEHIPPEALYQLPMFQFRFHVKDSVISNLSNPEAWLADTFEMKQSIKKRSLKLMLKKRA